MYILKYLYKNWDHLDEHLDDHLDDHLFSDGDI